MHRLKFTNMLSEDEWLQMNLQFNNINFYVGGFDSM